MEIIGSQTPLLLSQWKGYCRLEDVEKYINDFCSHPHFEGQLSLIALPQPLLKTLATRDLPPEIILGAKSMDSVDDNSFTESIALDLLKKAGAKFALIGSAESRYLLNESNKSINRKIHKLLDSEIMPILCIGETWEQYQNGRTTEIITAQLREGLQDLDEDQQAKVLLFFEAPWFKKSVKILSIEDCQQIYAEYQEAVHQVLSEVVQPNIRYVYAFPEELENLPKFVNQTEATGFYSENPEILIQLLESLVQGAAATFTTDEGESIKAVSSSKPFLETEISTPEAGERAPVAEIQQKTIGPSPEKGFAQDQKTPLLPLKTTTRTDKEAVTEREETSVNEEKPSPSDREVDSEPQGKTAISQSRVTSSTLPASAISPEKNKEMATSTEENKEIVDAAGQPLETSTSSKELEEDVLPSQKKIISPDSIEALEATEETGSDANIQPKPLAELTPQEEGAKEEALATIENRIAALGEDAGALEAFYSSMQEKAKRLNILRTKYPTALEAVSQSMSELDPELQKHISQGDMDFFNQHPDLFEKVRPTLKLIQQINEIIMEAAAIPREIDRLKSQAKKLREKVELEWDKLSALRHEIKTTQPDLVFPSIPKVLSTPPPQIDLTLPAMAGPSPLLSKKIGIVKREKKA